MDERVYDEEGYSGKWLTSDNGEHYFVRDGETPKEAWERHLAALKSKTTEQLKDELRVSLSGEEISVADAQADATALNALMGEEFKDVKGQAAIDKLMQEKRGHVKAAFHRDDIGDIDLLWGNDRLGLQHIIFQREKEKEGHAREILSDLATAIEKGTFQKRNNRGNFEFKYGKSYVVIAPEYHGNKITYLLTAYKRN